MIKEIQLQLLPAEAADASLVLEHLKAHLSLKKNTPLAYEILRRSIDARGKQIKILLKLRAFIDEVEHAPRSVLFEAKSMQDGAEVHIIGAGPAGLFCALQCIELGLKPIIFERGKPVRERRRDLARLNKEGILNEESNYCFGEGGAGTYSDSKLYTRSTKRGNVHRVLELFHLFGAEAAILYEAHPHIGTNKLPQIIEAMRHKIVECGGEIHFDSKLTDIECMNGQLAFIRINQHDRIAVQQVVLATGHSANDIYELLHSHQLLLEAKPFALGVRIEHPQELIDQLQYHCTTRDPYLPPASYSLVEQVNERGVFSFCMCPGGIIAPASTHANALVVNGWSPSKRNNPYANSGMVVGIQETDYASNEPLAGLAFQLAVEQKAFVSGGGKFVAPAQRMDDFVQNKCSSSLPACSYVPGVASVNLSEVLPDFVYQSLAKAFQSFGKKMKGYYTRDALVVATESRTSSPVRIPRDAETLQHLQVDNLYPCAEGAGYAGGIVSAAIDGMRVAESIARRMANGKHAS